MKRRGQYEIIGKFIFILIGIIAVVIIYNIVSSLSKEIEKGIEEKKFDSNINQFNECRSEEDCDEFGTCVNGICSVKSETGCFEVYLCEEWSECQVAFSLKDVIEKNVSLKGKQERNCFTTKNCLEDKTESLVCDYEIPIYAKNVEWCYENYTFVYEKTSERLVSRVKETEISQEFNLSRVDIVFPLNYENEKCSFCYNKIKDYDEEEIDCGGKYCKLCEIPYSFFDWLFVFIVGIWIIVGILVLYSILRRK